MSSRSKDTIHLFRAFGIDVELHWSWFLVALLQLQFQDAFASMGWHLATYLTVFLIVLLHEFGHALACKSTGGKAPLIVLWPLGGVAYVQPPRRPGAVLWSIAAGPLVNVMLVPLTFSALLLLGVPGAIGVSDYSALSDLNRYAVAVTGLNVMLLVFNMLPIYPLDGGQIVQALLWYRIGEVRSLRVVAGIGVIAAVLGGAVALYFGDLWLVLMAAFMGWRSFIGYNTAKALMRNPYGI